MAQPVGDAPLLCDEYDAALFDLDGVIYLGPNAVDGAAEGIKALRDSQCAVAFVTNNAARKPSVVAEQLNRIDVSCTVQDIVTSAQAVAKMMAEELEAGAKVLCVGTQALADEIAAVGLTSVASSYDEPDAVVQGYDPDMTWTRINEAVHAIQAGARWFASNLDKARPTDRGLEPGVRTQVDAVASCFEGKWPEVVGKPYPPLLKETVQRIGARKPIFVGDRLDTDIEGAFNAGMDSLFVFTGAHGIADLVRADAVQRPTHIGYDVRGLMKPARGVEIVGAEARCGEQRARLSAAQLEIEGHPAGREEQLDVLWAALQLIWRVAGRGELQADETYSAFIEQLRQLGELH